MNNNPVNAWDYLGLAILVGNFAEGRYGNYSDTFSYLDDTYGQGGSGSPISFIVNLGGFGQDWLSGSAFDQGSFTGSSGFSAVPSAGMPQLDLSGMDLGNARPDTFSTALDEYYYAQESAARWWAISWALSNASSREQLDFMGDQFDRVAVRRNMTNPS